MRTIISNKIYIKDATPLLIDYCKRELTVINPKWETLMRIGQEQQIIRYHIQKNMALYVRTGNDLTIPFGCLQAIWEYIKDFPYMIDFNNVNEISCKNAAIRQPLYDYQETAVEEMIKAKGGILIGRCGSGKTQIGIEIIKRIGLNALWLCHTKDLLTQTMKRIKFLYPDMPVGTITDGKIDMVNNGITISTIQTISNIDPDFYADKFGTVVTDECHHVANSPTLMKMFGRVIEKIPARYKYGITASEERNDSLTKTMYTTIGCNPLGLYKPVYTIERSLTKTLIAEHVKVELKTPFSYDMLNEDGTFNYIGLVDYLAGNEQRNNSICEKVLEMSKEHRKQLVLCSRIEQCELLHQKLLDLGLKSVLLVGKVTAKKREQILSEKVDWEVIVATLSLAKEGLDVVSLDTLHLASIVCNKSDTVQSVGRIERVCDGKNEPKVFDYVDTEIPYCTSRYKKRANWLKKR